MEARGGRQDPPCSGCHFLLRQGLIGDREMSRIRSKCLNPLSVPGGPLGPHGFEYPGPMCLISHTLDIMALCNTDSNGQKSNGNIAHSTSINRIRHQYIGNEGTSRLQVRAARGDTRTMKSRAAPDADTGLSS